MESYNNNKDNELLTISNITSNQLIRNHLPINLKFVDKKRPQTLKQLDSETNKN